MDFEEVLRNGLIFKGAKTETSGNKNKKVKTKAKKKAYISGAHDSDSAKIKAAYRRKRANRHR